jgi:hypothetical protein
MAIPEGELSSTLGIVQETQGFVTYSNMVEKFHIITCCIGEHTTDLHTVIKLFLHQHCWDMLGNAVYLPEDWVAITNWNSDFLLSSLPSDNDQSAQLPISSHDVASCLLHRLSSNSQPSLNL